jgi:hypothetical protein
MDDELERLRAVVRTHLAERRAFNEFSTHMTRMEERRSKAGEHPSEESIKFVRGLSDIVRDRKADLDQTLDRLREVVPGLFDSIAFGSGGGVMGDELERLRVVVRVYLAERRAWNAWSAPMRERLDRGDRSPPSDERIQQQRQLADVLKARQDDLAHALDRLREVAPGLFEKSG